MFSKKVCLLTPQPEEKEERPQQIITGFLCRSGASLAIYLCTRARLGLFL